MAGHIPLFSLRLGAGRLIGRQALRELWSRACASTDVAVGATPIDPAGGGSEFIYTLSGQQDMLDLGGIEGRLRVLVGERVPGSRVTLTRLV